MLVRGRPQSPPEELVNGLTHGLGLAAAAVAGPLVVGATVRRGADGWHVAGATVFAATLVTMYLTSTLYHLCPGAPADPSAPHDGRRARRKERLRTLDHAAIYLLIAGTYTPFLLGALRGAWGWSLFAAEWALAAVGIVAKLRWGFRWPRLSTWMYVGMGWLALVALKPLLERVSPAGVGWLVAGGVCYTAGVAFYATDWRVRYGHAVWHLFVAGGSACHVWAVLRHG
ncbi:hemolysin III [Gemmatimonadetes bacterium T265]|nr:hemolysin III [Gemmatimonadetes bacterium T265]